MSQVLVDDQDPRIVYTGDWEHNAATAEYGRTKSGASIAFLSARLNFNGIRVAVFGSLGSVDIDGIPTTTYAIDGVLVSTYTAPVIAPGYFTINTVFFQSTTLPDGEHTLEITFTNATRPNRYWLDYIQYTASITPSESSSSSLSSTDLPSPALEPSSSTVSQSEVASPSGAASSSSRTQVGPIVGGTLGGIAIIVIAALLLLIYLRLRRRDSKKVSSPESRPIEPFSSWRQDTRTPYSGTHIAMPSTSALSGSHDAPVSSTLPPIPGAGPPVPRTGQSAGSSSAPHKGHDLRTGPNTRATNGTSTVPLASTASASLDAAVRHHEDSGIRIPPTVVDVPPAYTQA